MKFWIWIFLLICFLALAVAASDQESHGQAEDRRKRRRRRRGWWYWYKIWWRKTFLQWPKAKLCKCGGENLPGAGRIVGGTELGVNQYPWLVGLSMDKIDDPITCGGVLINSRWVLTAAHCVKKHESDTLVWARIGQHEKGSDGSKVIRAAEIHSRSDYDTSTDLNDIALILLSEHVVIDKYKGPIGPACLPYTNYYSNKGIVAGWGGTNKDGTGFPNVPHKAELDIINIADCATKYDGKKTITTHHVCTLDSDGNKDTCTGDSGGPLMIKHNSRFYVHGVLSFGGFPCALPTIPAAYTRVHSYMNWITNTMKKNVQYNYCLY